MSREGDDGRAHNLTDSTSYSVPISQYESNSAPIKVSMNLAVDFNRSPGTEVRLKPDHSLLRWSAISCLKMLKALLPWEMVDNE